MIIDLWFGGGGGRGRVFRGDVEIVLILLVDFEYNLLCLCFGCRRLGFEVFKWSLFVCIERCCVVIGWFFIRFIDVLDLSLFFICGVEFIFNIGDVLRMEEVWRVNFNVELFLFEGMVIVWFDVVCLKIFL